MNATTNGKKTKTYNAWSAMIQRCYNPKAKNFKYYGGRGITVCDRWREDRMGFHNFVVDLGEAPLGTWLDRVNNDGNYCKDNCKWSTPKEQAANRRQGGGPPLNPDSIRQRARAAGLPYHVALYRHRVCWNVDLIYTTPVNYHCRKRHPDYRPAEFADGKDIEL